MKLWDVCAKRVGWLTSEPSLAKDLADEAHRFTERLVRLRDDGQVCRTRVYLPIFTELVLEAVKGCLLGRGSVSAVELLAAGSIADRAELTQDPDYEEYWDDVNGG